MGKHYRLQTYFTGQGRNKPTIEKEVIAHFTDVFNRTGRGVETLRAMHAAKIISKLPDFAVPEAA